MITPELFNKSEVLRLKLFDALPILEVAFAAIAQNENMSLLATKHEPMEIAIAHGKQLAKIELVAALHALAQRPPGEMSPEEAVLYRMPSLDEISRAAQEEYDRTQKAINHETQ